MALPPNYKPESYKSKDLFQRLGLRRELVPPALVEQHWRAIMDYWAQMRNVTEKEEEVRPAQDAVTEARNVLSDPVRLQKYMSEPAPESSESSVLLIGGRGAGKSALVGAIYDVCQRELAIEPLAVRFSPDTRSNVLTNLRALKAFCDPRVARTSPSLIRVPNPNDSAVPYNLIVTHRGKDQLQIKFIDTAGEDLHRVLSGQQSDSFLSRQIRNCHAAILVVDTPALTHQAVLERDGIWDHSRRNMPDNVEALVQDWVQSNPDAPRIFCMVPIKTETELYDPASGRRAGAIPGSTERAIIERTLKEFEGAVSLLKQNGNCVVVVTPIETCGCLRLCPNWPPPVSEKSDYPAESWDSIVDYRNPLNAKAYSPANCELPLVFILNFFLKLLDGKGNDSSPQQLIERLQIPVSVIEMFGVLGKESIAKFVHGWNEVLSRCMPILGFLGGILGGRGTFASEDTKAAVRQVMNRTTRFDSVLITGNTDLLTLL
jgi:hypothetical protein